MTNNDSHSKPVMWLSEPLPGDVCASLQRIAGSDDVQHVAVMPDVHLAGDICNGTAIATRELIYPLAVGGDIGCGMLAVGIDLAADVLAEMSMASRLLAGLYKCIPCQMHSRSNCCDRLPGPLAETLLSTSRLEKLKGRAGLLQLGTLGRGNHFVEFQADAEGRLWLMLHSGSRAMGQAITEHHLRATRTAGSGLGFLEASNEAGRSYLSDLNWAIDYALENRLAMARAVELLIGLLMGATVDWSTMIHCHHNHVRREVHGHEEFWVHRKGALPAAENELGVIPGSMGSRSYHVAGRGFAGSLKSSSHGAGRLFARQQARRSTSRHELLRQMKGVWFDQRQADGLRDEVPSAYKDIGRIMRAQRELTRIVRELRPVLVYKGVTRQRHPH